MANSNENEAHLFPISPSYQSYQLMNKLAISLAVAAIFIALASIPFLYAIQKKLRIEDINLIARIGQLKQTNQEELAAQNHTIEQSQENLQNQLNEMNKALQMAMNQKFYQNQDWLLLKARHYLELAQIHAHWSDNFDAAISLLQQADALLISLHSPKILELRQAIAKEIALLKASPLIDIAGLLSQLDAVQIQIDHLSIQDEKQSQKNTSPINKTDSVINTSSWQSHLQDSLLVFKKLLVVRRINPSFTPLMSPLFESLIKENIRLNLQEAQWAVLNQNPMVYQLALRQASRNIKRNFPSTSEKNIKLLEQVDKLQQSNITQKKPAIDLALPLLNQMIKDLPDQKGDLSQ